MKPKVLVTRPLPAAAAARLENAADVTVHPEDTLMPYDALAAGIAAAEGLVCVLTDRVDADVIARAASLRVISTVAAGFDNIDVAAAHARGIVVTNTPGALTETTADLTWALLLATARRIVEADVALRRGEFHTWQLQGFLGYDVYGKTLGVVGFGRIGQAVARRAAGFGMRVLYYSRTPAAPDVERALRAERVSLETLLAESHFVSLHTPLTPATHHMIDARAIARMRRDAIVVNVARGPVVDEAALVRALTEGRIAGAGFDVYEREPALAPGLVELQNVVLLPHIGSASHETRARMAELAVADCLTVLDGGTPRHPVRPPEKKA